MRAPPVKMDEALPGRQARSLLSILPAHCLSPPRAWRCSVRWMGPRMGARTWTAPADGERWGGSWGALGAVQDAGHLWGGERAVGGREEEALLFPPIPRKAFASEDKFLCREHSSSAREKRPGLPVLMDLGFRPASWPQGIWSWDHWAWAAGSLSPSGRGAHPLGPSLAGGGWQPRSLALAQIPSSLPQPRRIFNQLQRKIRRNIFHLETKTPPRSPGTLTTRPPALAPTHTSCFPSWQSSWEVPRGRGGVIAPTPSSLRL